MVGVPFLLTMWRRRAVLADRLALALLAAQPADQAAADQEAQDQRGQERRDRAERDVAEDIERAEDVRERIDEIVKHPSASRFAAACRHHGIDDCLHF